MRAPAWFGLLMSAVVVACNQVADVDNVTYVAEAGARDGAPLRDATAKRDGGADSGPDAPDGAPTAASLAAEDCPSCGGSMCCSPKHCATSDKCCADRAGPCTTAADCCNGDCDVDAGRCGGPCLAEGQSPCVTGSDCCGGDCNSAGVCATCAGTGKGCAEDGQCCFGLECSTGAVGTVDASVCLAL